MRSEPRRAGRGAAVVLFAAGLAGCASPPLDAPRVLVFGEQHDQPDQQRQVARAVADEAAAGRLAAVVLEMADRGTGTGALPPQASEPDVQQALQWNEAGWPWAQYGPVVMAAVRARVPVLGGNLPRTAMRGAMADGTLDATVPEAVKARLGGAIDEGHCGLLPAAMLPGMVRVQIARDQAMAEVVRTQLARGHRVVLLTGAQHASRDRGVPLHLEAAGVAPSQVQVVMFSDAGALVADERRPAEVTPGPDRCEALRQRMAPKGPG